MGRLRPTGSEDLAQQQPLALLCYLSMGGPRSRRHLATVFWPEAKQPLNNLSSAISRIRDRVPGAIVAERQTVSATIETDVADLKAAIECLDADEILRLYQGHFFELADVRSMGLELEEWVFSTREVLARASATALLAAGEAISAADPAKAAALAEEAHRIGHTFWVTADPWQRTHDLANTVGSFTAARVRVEAADNGFDLERAAPRKRPDELQPVGSLFGRSDELAALSSFVDESTPEWLAIVGMGGVGKTALARAFVDQLAGSMMHVRTPWVSLADVRDVDRLRDAIAAALGVPLSADADFVDVLVGRCSPDRPVVMVLDNLEQLNGYEAVLADVAPVSGLTVIVTSRIATGHSYERALRLEGLATDSHSAAGPAMFTAAAAPNWPEVVEHPELVERVCALVDGLPLAIELCAGWLRTIPLDVLVDSLTESGELVQASPAASLESMESILDRSYELLDEVDAHVLGHLALFDGPFSYADATAVGATSLTTLTRLIDCSLLERNDNELTLHPLVRSHARDQLLASQAAVAASGEERFISRFEQLIVAGAAKLRGPDAGTVTPAIAEGLPNIIAAWELALDRGQFDVLAAMVDGLDLHLKSQSRQFLAARLFEQALDRIEGPCTAAEPDVAARNAFVAIGWRYAFARMVQGGHGDAKDAIERCIALHVDSDRFGGAALGYTQGHRAIFDGDYETAAQQFTAARALDDGSVPEWLIAEIDAGSALVALTLGNNDEGRRLLRSVLDTGRRLGNPVTITSAYYFLGALECAENPATALVLLEEGNVVARQASMTYMARKNATVIGRCHIKLGNPRAAIDVFVDALNESADETNTVREPWVRVANQSGMAMAYAAMGDTVQATPWFTDALRAQVAHDDWPLLLESVLEISRLRIDQATDPRWRDLLTVVSTHPATNWEWKRDVNELVEEAGVDFTIDATEADAVHPRIDVLAEQALALLKA